MDLTTRRGDMDGSPDVGPAASGADAMCRDGADPEGGCDIGATPDAPPQRRIASSFSIRSLVGGEDDRAAAADGGAAADEPQMPMARNHRYCMTPESPAQRDDLRTSLTETIESMIYDIDVESHEKKTISPSFIKQSLLRHYLLALRGKGLTSRVDTIKGCTSETYHGGPLERTRGPTGAS
ncbi:hypothetical protein EVAR_13501_1 [Eumeta japonica]|uniref:Uncharacterized protein n=1 Tax=Eumeta variegata TaxID=151549 RepID=A0A4C1UY12_EUMVA|nr:hypothetical protein EVAR_13501_1 [Eumeta japonica]